MEFFKIICLNGLFLFFTFEFSSMQLIQCHFPASPAPGSAASVGQPSFVQTGEELLWAAEFCVEGNAATALWEQITFLTWGATSG